MPVANPNQPTVAVQVPVPTPVQTQKPRQAPVTFPAPQQGLHQRMGATPRAVILPWSPPPRRMARLPRKVIKFAAPIRYSHGQFLQKIARFPADVNHRSVYADWLEDHAPETVTPQTLEFLRNHQGPAWVARNSKGDVKAGKRWSIPEIRAANKAAGKNWFDRSSTRFFGTRINPRHVFSGPGGVYFVHEGDNFNRTAREYRIAMFHPKTGDTSSWSIYHAGLPTPETGEGNLGDRLSDMVSSIFAPNDPFQHQEDAIGLAKQLAAGTSPYPKNDHYRESEHGPDVDKRVPRVDG